MIPLIVLASLAVQVPDDSLMTRGVSRELATYRAAHIRDVRYDLTLDVTKPSAASGSVRISFRRVNGGDVYVDFRGSDFSNVFVNDKPIEAVEYNRAHMRFQAALFRNGLNTISVRFKSPIAPAG